MNNKRSREDDGGTCGDAPVTIQPPAVVVEKVEEKRVEEEEKKGEEEAAPTKRHKPAATEPLGSPVEDDDVLTSVLYEDPTEEVTVPVPPPSITAPSAAVKATPPPKSIAPSALEKVKATVTTTTTPQSGTSPSTVIMDCRRFRS